MSAGLSEQTSPKFNDVAGEILSSIHLLSISVTREEHNFFQVTFPVRYCAPPHSSREGLRK